MAGIYLGIFQHDPGLSDSPVAEVAVGLHACTGRGFGKTVVCMIIFYTKIKGRLWEGSWPLGRPGRQLEDNWLRH